MYATLRIDNKDYSDFTRVYSINEDNEDLVYASLKHNDNSIYDLTGLSATCKLIFQNTLVEYDRLELVGSIDDELTGILVFDLNNFFASKGNNVYKVQLLVFDTTNHRQYNISMGKLIIVKKL